MSNPSDRDHRGLRKLFSRSKKEADPVQSLQSTQTSQINSTTAASSTVSLKVPAQAATPVQILPSTTPKTLASTAGSYDDIASLRNALWRRAYDDLRKEDPDLVAAYELLAQDSASLSSSTFTAEDMASVAEHQKIKIKNKQWTYPWFGKSRMVRDTVESILSVVSQASELISTGMSMASPFVSLPWSMVSILIPFVMEDYKTMQEAVDGLKEVTSILASYTYADQEYLTSEVTRNDYGNIVSKLYSTIFAYEAAVALYFAKNTLRRLGFPLKPGQNRWSDALEDVKNEASKCNSSLQALNTRLSQKSMAELQGMTQRGFQMMMNAFQQATAERNRKDKLSQWLSPINVAQDHSDLRKLLGEQYLGSGRWLLDEEEAFQGWKSAQEGVFLLQGVVGTGKSSLTSIVIEELLQNSHEQVAFFYCSARTPDSGQSRSSRNDFNNIIRSLLAQCVYQPDGSIARSVLESYDASIRHNTGECDLNTLQEALLELKDTRVTFIIDALDECAEQDRLFSALAEIAKVKVNLRIFVSSRPGVDLSYHIPPRYMVKIGSKNHLDIGTYIEKEIQHRYPSSGMTQNQADRLCTALERYSEGMFRWVVLEINLFLPTSRHQGRRQSRDLEMRLKKLETSEAPVIDKLFEAYEEIYSYAMGDEDEFTRRTIVETAIKTILCAIRPLSSRELALLVWLKVERMDELRTELEDESWLSLAQRKDIDPLRSRDLQTLWKLDDTIELDSWEEDILEYCSNFFARSATGEIRLAHLSVRQFFETQKRAMFTSAQQHLEAASNCTLLRTYMLVDEEHYTNAAVTAQSLHARAQEGLAETHDSIAGYVREYWYIHAHGAAASTEFTDLLNRFRSVLEVETPLHRIMFDIAGKEDLASRDLVGDTRLHKAVRLGWSGHIKCLARVDALFCGSLLVNVRNNAGNSPLHLAVLTGYPESSVYLLFGPSLLEKHNRYNITGLQLSVTCDRYTMISNARVHGYDVSCPDKDGRTPLHYAMYFGRKGIAELAMSYQNRFDTTNDTVQSAMDLARTNRPWNIVYTDELTQSKDMIRDNDDPVTEAMTRLTQRQLSGHQLEAKETHARPRVVILNPEVSSCNKCDLSKWIDGSRNSSQYSLRVNELQKSGQKGCPLCTKLYKEIASRWKIELGRNLEVKVSVDLDHDSLVKRGRDFLRFSADSLSYKLPLELYLDTQDQDQQLSQRYTLITGRHVPPKVDQDAVISRIQRWQTACQESHEKCLRQNPTTASQMPTWIIDVSDPTETFIPRVLRTERIHEFRSEYVFVSYNLGGKDFEQYGTYRNLSEAEKAKGFDLATLAPVYRDSMAICRALGYKYLWIDALCLGADKQEEVSRVGRYIAGAKLVIASTGADVKQSLFDTSNRDLPANEPLGLDICFEESKSQKHKLYIGEVSQDVRAAVRENILSRTWRVQEAYLAHRLLVIGGRQAYWMCTQSVCFESTSANLPPFVDSLPLIRLSLERLRKYSEFEEAHRVALDHWYTIAEKISNGQLSYETDRLNATVGIIQSFSALDELQHDQYLHGLWKSDLAFGLLWKSEPLIMHRERLKALRRIETDQSWSWTSMTSPVSYLFLAGLVAARNCNAPQYFKLLEVIKRPAVSVIVNEVEEIACLKVSTLCCDFSSSSEAKNFEYLLDIPNSHVDDPLMADPPLKGTLLALVAVWRCKPNDDPQANRWMGLVLRHDEKRDGYLREGIFIGPSIAEDLKMWKEMEITMM